MKPLAVGAVYDVYDHAFLPFECDKRAVIDRAYTWKDCLSPSLLRILEL